MNRLISFIKDASVLVVCAIGICSASTPTAETSVWWTPDIGLTSLTDLDSALSRPVLVNGKPVSAVLVNDSQQKTVTTCREFLDAINQNMYSPDERGLDFPFINRCYALSYLRSAQNSKQSFIESSWADDALNRLPPFLVFVEASLAQKADEARNRGESWGRFDPTMKIVDRSARVIVFQNDTDRWYLGVVAQGDFNHDGFADQVVIACDNKLRPGGGFCFPIVLTAYNPNQVMRLISSPSMPYKFSPGS